MAISIVDIIVFLCAVWVLTSVYMGVSLLRDIRWHSTTHAFLFARSGDILIDTSERKWALFALCFVPVFGIKIHLAVRKGLMGALVRSGLDKATYAYFKLGIHDLRDILEWLSDNGEYTESVILSGYYAIQYESVTNTAMRTAELFVANGPVDLNDFDKCEQVCMMALLREAAKRERLCGDDDMALRMDRFSIVENGVLGAAVDNSGDDACDDGVPVDKNEDPEYQRKVNVCISHLRRRGLREPLDIIEGVYDAGYHEAVGWMLTDYINRNTKVKGDGIDDDDEDTGYESTMDDPFSGKFADIACRLIREHGDTDAYMGIAEFVLPYEIKEEEYENCGMISDYLKKYKR